MKKAVIAEKNLRWLGIDFDGVVAHNTGYPKYILTKPIKGAKEALEGLTNKSWKIIIYTARPWSDYELIENWLIYHNIPFRRIICGKPLFKYIIDDRNIEFKNDWNEVLKKIK